MADVQEFMVRGIVVGLFQENCYVVGSRRSREGIVIDPGDDPQEILALARDMGVDIRRIVCTHAHLDHIMAVPAIKQAVGAPFLLHAADEPILKGVPFSAQALLGRELALPQPDAWIQDGDDLELEGARLRVLHSPGHTPGSVAILGGGMLFSGDTLFRKSIGRTDLPGGDARVIMRSIVDILLRLPDETVVLPGHMQETTIGGERASNPFIQEELRRRAGTSA